MSFEVHQGENTAKLNPTPLDCCGIVNVSTFTKVGSSVLNNSFKTFLLKLLAFFAVVFVVDFAIGHLLKKFYFKQQAGYDFLTTWSMEKTNADILIFDENINIEMTMIKGKIVYAK